MNNLSSYCGFVDAKIRASDKDLPVLASIQEANSMQLYPIQGLKKSLDLEIENNKELMT